ncbi:hypothetical protein KL936_000775 [Ogataea polymorpha]|nr:hypothetical protein KL936_000775 [Ogataea polymorpha]
MGLNYAIYDVEPHKLLSNYFLGTSSTISTLFIYSLFAYGYSMLPDRDLRKIKLGQANPFILKIETSLLTILAQVNTDFRSLQTIAVTLIVLINIHLGNYDITLAWSYNALLMSIVQNAGLHVTTDLPNNKEVSQLRSRLFWNCAMVDKITSCILGRNSLLSHVLSPNYTSVSTEELVFEAQVKLWFLHDKFINYIYSFTKLNINV